MKRAKRRTNEKTQDLHIRVSKREKNKLVKEATESVRQGYLFYDVHEDTDNGHIHFAIN